MKQLFATVLCFFLFSVVSAKEPVLTSRLAYVQRIGGTTSAVVMVNEDLTTKSLLMPGHINSVQWTTDGSLVFELYNGLLHTIWKWTPALNRNIKLSPVAADASLPHVMADGSIWYVIQTESTHQLWKMDSEGYNQQKLSEFHREATRYFSFSTESLVAYTTGRSAMPLEFVTQGLAFGGFGTAGVNVFPMLSPDGHFITIEDWVDGQNRIGFANITDNLDDIEYPDLKIPSSHVLSWGPNSRFVVLARYFPQQTGTELYTWNLEGDPVWQFNWTSTIVEALFSNDKNFIAFVTSEDKTESNGALYIRNPDTNELFAIGFGRHPVWEQTMSNPVEIPNSIPV